LPAPRRQADGISDTRRFNRTGS